LQRKRSRKMKKVAFMLGLGVGFLLGSRAGRGPYEGLEEKVRSFRERPEVDDTVARAKQAAGGQVADAVDKVSEKVNEKLPPSKQVAV
jgi:hypothetical protein